jgi:hypothetical protein
MEQENQFVITNDMTVEQKRAVRLAKKRVYARNSYEKNCDEIRQRALERYYEKKKGQPPTKVGRPRKYLSPTEEAK